MSGSATAGPLSSLVVVILLGSVGIIAINIGVPTMWVVNVMGLVVTLVILFVGLYFIRGN